MLRDSASRAPRPLYLLGYICDWPFFLIVVWTQRCSPTCLQCPCLASSLSHSKLQPPLLCHSSEVLPPTLLLHCQGLQVYLICHPILLQVILHSLIPTVLPSKPLLQHPTTLTPS